MNGVFERKIKPIVVVDKDEFRACYDFVSKAREKTWDADPEEFVENVAKIEIKMRNDDKYTTLSVDDFFEFENKSDNPIKTVEISKGSYGSNYIRLTLGGFWFDGLGAKIVIHGDKTFSDGIISNFEKVLKKDRSIGDFIPSSNPFLLSAVLTALLIYTFIDHEVLQKFVRDTPFLPFSLLAALLIAGPMMILSAIATALQSHFFGRCVFYWSDGRTRFDRNKSVVNYLFWVLPTSVVLKSLKVF